MALISSADADHLDIYGDDLSVKSSFKEFASLVKDGGILLSKFEVELDFESRAEVRHYTYSMNNTKADFYAENIRLDKGLYVFDLVTPDDKYLNLKLGIPALVNVENAVGACSAAIISGVKYEELLKSLPDFKGIRRRFDIRLKTDQFVLIDDYAHHPEEIKATINSVRALYPDQRITGVFQPHLFSRTKDFHKEFAESLSLLDELIMLDIYPARELPMEGVSSEMILDLVGIDVKKNINKS